MRLSSRPWLPAASRERISAVTAQTFADTAAPGSITAAIEALARDSERYLYCPETLIEPPRPWRSCSDTTVVVRQVTVSGPGLP